MLSRPISMCTSPNVGLMMRSFCQRYGARSLILSQWDGPTRCVSCIRMSASSLFGTTSNAFMRDAGLRIDHLLLSAAAAARLVSASVDREVRGWEKASDHAPTWIVID